MNRSVNYASMQGVRPARGTTEAAMYAVIQTGGKQYKVSEGARLKVEKLDAEIGSDIELKDVLMMVDGADVKVGRPFLDSASVKATVVEHGKGRKVVVFKKKRRKGYKVKRGHRQHYTTIQVKAISG